jgi:hypothetical protein
MSRFSKLAGPLECRALRPGRIAQGPRFRARELLLPLVVLALAAAASGARLREPAIRVAGKPIVTERPAVQIGNEWFLPLAPIARALGAQISVKPDTQEIRVRRADGAEVVYDGRTGEIRQRFLLVGRLANYREVQISLQDEQLMFPVNGVVELLGVTVQEDAERNALNIEPAAAAAPGGQQPMERSVQLATLDYNYSFATSGHQYSQVGTLRGTGVAGGAQLTGNLLLNRVPSRAFLSFGQGTLYAEFSGGRQWILGDQATFTGLEALVTTVRGVGYRSRLKGFRSYAYGGRAVGSTFASLSTGYVKYDMNLGGFGVERKWQRAQLTFAGNAFQGAERSGSTVGAAFSSVLARNQFQGQALGGWFSGLSSRTTLATAAQTASSDVLLPGSAQARPSDDGPANVSMVDEQGRLIVLIPQYQRTHVQGMASGLSVSDTFTPFPQISLSGQWERYGRNFLAARDDSRFNATSNRAASLTLRPFRYLSLTGGATGRDYLLGNLERTRSYNYGANGSLPLRFPVQLGFFHSIQLDESSPFRRMEMTQYSFALPSVKRYSAFASYSEMKLGTLLVRNASANVVADCRKYGQFGFHDQVQAGMTNRFGVDWSGRLRGRDSFLRLGLDRLSSRNQKAALAPLVGFKIPLPRGQSFTLTYRADRGTQMLQFEMGGPIVRHRELARNANGVTTVVVQAPMTGRVYIDTDLDAAFDARVDKPARDIRVWLDNRSVTTDGSGFYRFEQVTPGAHLLRAELNGVPAGFVFADSSDRTVAVAPYRVNSQDFRIIKTGRIAGQVLTPDYRSDPDGPLERPFPDARIVTGDVDTFSEANGYFLLGDLPPGTYVLRPDPASIPAGYVAEPSSLVAEVRAGQTVSGIVFRLRIPPKPVIEKALPPQEVQFSGPAPAPGSPSSQRR